MAGRWHGTGNTGRPFDVTSKAEGRQPARVLAKVAAHAEAEAISKTSTSPMKRVHSAVFHLGSEHRLH